MCERRTWHTHTQDLTHTARALAAKRRKMRSTERRSLKFQCDTGEEWRASSSSGSSSVNLLSNRPPHQYENESAVTVAGVRLPWHTECLEDAEVQGSVWGCRSIKACPLIWRLHECDGRKKDGKSYKELSKVLNTFVCLFWWYVSSNCFTKIPKCKQKSFFLLVKTFY